METELTINEQIGYGLLINVLKRYDHGRHMIKIHTKKEVLIVVEKKEFIYTKIIPMEHHGLEIKNVNCVKIRVAKASSYNSYTGLNPAKVFEDVFLNHWLSDHYVHLHLDEIIKVELLPRKTNYNLKDAKEKQLFIELFNLELTELSNPKYENAI